ncbi:class I SAM-dependent methyltransferase [Paenibacillus sp. OSY-SE]|uniref:class I SAM-dependent methyltransferase n=1 Tax=Paenibacillus sp. OSY-SE TaxID=1196323 RepID=UPI00030F031A|nr:class I SAM-dependent methyltransferase [Paenibacillus sp. OSY-SE]
METTNKFTGKADTYSKYRPNYPTEYMNYLISSNQLTSNHIIADIGSGTGVFTQQLLDRNFKVFAVEPNRDMRTIAEKALNSYSSFISIQGTAENTGIQSSSIDLATVAQAFHWFDKDKFKLECQRILKPNSNVALVWNSRDSSSLLVNENAEVCKQLCSGFKGFSGGIDETPDIYKDFFKDGKYEYEVFRHDLEFNLEGFVGRNLSASYAPKPTDANYNPFIEAVTELFIKYSSDNMIVIPNITRSYIGNV